MVKTFWAFFDLLLYLLRFGFLQRKPQLAADAITFITRPASPKPGRVFFRGMRWTLWLSILVVVGVVVLALTALRIIVEIIFHMAVRAR